MACGCCAADSERRRRWVGSSGSSAVGTMEAAAVATTITAAERVAGTAMAAATAGATTVPAATVGAAGMYRATTVGIENVAAFRLKGKRAGPCRALHARSAARSTERMRSSACNAAHLRHRLRAVDVARCSMHPRVSARNAGRQSRRRARDARRRGAGGRHSMRPRAHSDSAAKQVRDCMREISGGVFESLYSSRLVRSAR